MTCQHDAANWGSKQSLLALGLAIHPWAKCSWMGVNPYFHPVKLVQLPTCPFASMRTGRVCEGVFPRVVVEEAEASGVLDYLPVRIFKWSICK